MDTSRQPVVKKIQAHSRQTYLRIGLGLPIICFLILIHLQLLLTDSFNKPGIWVMFITTPLAAIGSYFQFSKKKPSSYDFVLIAIIFHLVVILFLTFVAPLSSVYWFMWVLLIISSRVDIGPKGVVASYITLVVTYLLTLWYRANFSIENLLSGAVVIILITVISQLLLNTRKDEQIELSELKGSLNRELFERQRLLSLINNMGDAVLATDKNGKILLYNAAVLNLLDTNVSLDGKQLDAVLNLHDKKHHKVKLLHLAQHKNVGFTSSDYAHQFGKDDEINVYVNIAPIKLGFKEQIESGYIIILRDITKEKSLEEERDEFISVISHELRTPVTIAEGNISNAIFSSTNAKAPSTIIDPLKQAHDQVVFLGNMINDLATLSRAERTDVPLTITSINPKKLIYAIGRDYESEAATKKLKLTVSAANNLKPINTSELYLHEILQNFVTNSIKYTKKGSIIAHVRSDQAGNAIFSVADTGIGLSKADQKRVFDKFFRSEDYRTRESSGTGLGLYVTAKLAHRLNATIAMESELNKGTTFTITVPSLPQPSHQKQK